jgi:hypothetical protein
MNEVRFAVGDADAGPQERLGKEISAYNAAVTGTMRGRMLSVAVRGMTVTCALGSTGGHGRCGYIGRTPGSPHGYDDLRRRS